LALRDDLQRGLEEKLLQVALAEQGRTRPEKPECILLHYDTELVFRCWQERRLHGTLPQAGGLLDQDALLMEDLAVLDWEYACLLDDIAPASDGGIGMGEP